MPNHRIANFGPGPSALPESVLKEAALGLLNFENTGIGIAEISHRSEEFITESLIREQLEVPDTHYILFIQGGGTAQFSTVVLNLLARHRLLHPSLPEEQQTLDYVVTGYWSDFTSQEARRLAE